MIRRLIVFIFILSFLLAFYACEKQPTYSNIPHIEFVSLTKIPNNLGYDDKGTLEISFTDGDGDIGLSSADTVPPYDTSSIYYYDFFITYFEKQHGVYTQVKLPMTNNSRIPIINASLQNKPMHGFIDIELYINNYFSSYDTIHYTCYIVDRALHPSNIITTSDLIINKH